MSYRIHGIATIPTGGDIAMFIPSPEVDSPNEELIELGDAEEEEWIFCKSLMFGWSAIVSDLNWSGLNPKALWASADNLQTAGIP